MTGLLLTALALAAPDSVQRSSYDSLAALVWTLAPPWTPISRAQDSLTAHGYHCRGTMRLWDGSVADTVVPSDPATFEGPLCTIQSGPTTWQVGLLAADERLSQLEICTPAAAGPRQITCRSYRSPPGRAPLSLALGLTLAILGAVLVSTVLLLARDPGLPGPLPPNVESILVGSLETNGSHSHERGVLAEYRAWRRVSRYESAVRWCSVRARGRRVFVFGWLWAWGLPMFAVLGVPALLRDRTTLGLSRLSALAAFALFSCALGALLVGWLIWRFSERNLRRLLDAERAPAQMGAA